LQALGIGDSRDVCNIDFIKANAHVSQFEHEVEIKKTNFKFLSRRNINKQFFHFLIHSKFSARLGLFGD
jgi:hypothetical protein